MSKYYIYDKTTNTFFLDTTIIKTIYFHISDKKCKLSSHESVFERQADQKI